MQLGELIFLMSVSCSLIKSSGSQLHQVNFKENKNDPEVSAVANSNENETSTLQIQCPGSSKSCWSKFEGVKNWTNENEFQMRGRQRRELRLKTTILSPRVTTVQRGSILNLLCVIQEHDKPPERISWVINGSLLNFQLHRGGVHLELIRQKKSTTSKLTINDFRHEDAGTYECRAEGYNNQPLSDDLKATIMSPSYRDSVEVKVVEHIKKEMFSDAGKLTPLSICLVLIAFIFNSKIK